MIFPHTKKKGKKPIKPRYALDIDYFCQLNLLFYLFLLLFMHLTAFFNTIHELLFQLILSLSFKKKKTFNFNKINQSQTYTRIA